MLIGYFKIYVRPPVWIHSSLAHWYYENWLLHMTICIWVSFSLVGAIYVPSLLRLCTQLLIWVCYPKENFKNPFSYFGRLVVVPTAIPLPRHLAGITCLVNLWLICIMLEYCSVLSSNFTLTSLSNALYCIFVHKIYGIRRLSGVYRIKCCGGNIIILLYSKSG